MKLRRGPAGDRSPPDRGLVLPATRLCGFTVSEGYEVTEKCATGLIFRIIQPTGNSRSILTLSHDLFRTGLRSDSFPQKGIEVPGGMADRIALKCGSHTIIALAMLTAAISSGQPSRAGCRPGRDQRVDARIASRMSSPVSLCVGMVASRSDRMKAVASEKEQDLGRPFGRERWYWGFMIDSRVQAVRDPTHSGLFRPHNPLRC